MNDPNNFGANLKVLKEESQLSLSQFSEVLQLPKSTLQSVMEGGQTSLDTACRISNALGIPLSVLTNGSLSPKKATVLRGVLSGLQWYKELPLSEQEVFAHNFAQLLEVLQK